MFSLMKYVKRKIRDDKQMTNRQKKTKESVMAFAALNASLYIRDLLILLNAFEICTSAKTVGKQVTCRKNL